MSKLTLETGDYTNQGSQPKRFSIEYLSAEGQIFLDYDGIEGTLVEEQWDALMQSDIFSAPERLPLSLPGVRGLVDAMKSQTLECNLFQNAIIIANAIDMPKLDGPDSESQADHIATTLSGHIPDPRGKKDLFIVPQSVIEEISDIELQRMRTMNQLGHFRIDYAEDGWSGFYHQNGIEGEYRPGATPGFAVDEATTGKSGDCTYEHLKKIQRLAAQQTKFGRKSASAQIVNTKIGEAQIADKFKRDLVRCLERAGNVSANYVSADFAGKQDRVFADYFASTASSAVLIEFKEFEEECHTEKRKDFRKTLCEELAKTFREKERNLSQRCHFIGWGETHETHIHVRLQSYISKVSPLFVKLQSMPESSASVGGEEFIRTYLSNKIGLSLSDMNKYVGYLALIAGRGSEECPEFRGLLTTVDILTGAAIDVAFNDLCELVNLMEIYKKELSRLQAPQLPKPPGRSFPDLGR